MGFKFYKTSDMIIINSVTYKTHKYLMNQASTKVKMPSSSKSECSYSHIHVFKLRIMGLCLAWAVNSPKSSFDILLRSQLWIHLIKDKTSLFPRFWQKFCTLLNNFFGGWENVESRVLLQNRSYPQWIIVFICKGIFIWSIDDGSIVVEA